MKEELYLWIRNLAVFYIFFTAVLNLIPDQKYEKYVRFFMGLLLIFMMSTPIFSILGKGSELTESFLNNFSEENRICIQIVRNESGKMGNPVAHRSTSGSSGDACIQ